MFCLYSLGGCACLRTLDAMIMHMDCGPNRPGLQPQGYHVQVQGQGPHVLESVLESWVLYLEDE